MTMTASSCRDRAAEVHVGETAPMHSPCDDWWPPQERPPRSGRCTAAPEPQPQRRRLPAACNLPSLCVINRACGNARMGCSHEVVPSHQGTKEPLLWQSRG